MGLCAARIGWPVSRGSVAVAVLGIALICSLLGLRALAQGPSGSVSVGTAEAGTARGWASLPVAARVSVSGAIGSEQRQFRVHRLRDGTLSAHAGGVSAEFASDGVNVAGGSGLSLRLGLLAVARGANRVRPLNVTPRVTGPNVVSYARAGVREWYVIGPLGLEQGFVLVRRPAGWGTLTLTVGVLSGATRARAGSDGSLTLSDGAGQSRLSYGDVSVTDALGRPLTARIAVRGRRVLVRVDEVKSYLVV